jgi:hypothetical protein
MATLTLHPWMRMPSLALTAHRAASRYRQRRREGVEDVVFVFFQSCN